MRTSRASKETSKVLQALSPPARRQTRSSALNTAALRDFAYTGGSTIKLEDIPTIGQITRDDDESSLSSANTEDIEDLIEPPLKRQKRSASPTVLTASNRTPRRPQQTKQSIKNEPIAESEPIVKGEPIETNKPIVKNEPIVKSEPEERPAPPPKARRMPARKTRDAEGTTVVEPPSNWEIMYNTVKKMREDNPTAPVDTMGCAELYWRASGPKDRRFQTLIALMLSSQTKDTVTAVAMQRLHTELGQGAEATTDTLGIKPEEDVKPLINDIPIKTEVEESKAPMEKDSTLNLDNILAVSPVKLNELIRTVGFHNNKTKYIKAAALILRDEYEGDIPSTPEGLMSLPGVGPKMAYLCMSAAWGKHEGIGVDVHVHRITNLWGWHKTKNPEETRMALQSWLPRDKWHEINKLLVGLGQTACLPVKRRCGECYLAGTKLCKSEVKGLANGNPIKAERTKLEDEPKIKIESV